MMKKAISIALAFVALLCCPVAYGQNVFVISSIAQLRTIPVQAFPVAYVTQYSAATGIGGGDFVTNGVTTCTDNGGTIIQAVGGCYFRKTAGQPYDISWFGAFCDGIAVQDAVSTSSATITSASARWASVHANDKVVIFGAAVSGKEYSGTVSSVNSSSSLTITPATSTSGTGMTVYVYTDDHSAFSSALAAANATSSALSSPAVSLTLPQGKSCGFSNPGSLTALTFTSAGVGLNLNNGQLWLGQTGSAQDTGYELQFLRDNQWVNGPGLIDGLYQTNQGFPQLNLAGVIWFGGGTQIGSRALIGGGMQNGVVVQNTKGTSVEAYFVQNWTLSDVSAYNCGDYQYVPGSGDPETGRQFCYLISGASGSTNLSNFTATKAAQSGILIQDFNSVSNPAAVINVSNFTSYDAGFYDFDNEGYPGSINFNNVSTIGTGACTPTGSTFVCGGTVVASVNRFTGNGLQSYGIDANAVSFQLTNNVAVASNYLGVQGITLRGTTSLHAADLFISLDGSVVPQQAYLSDVVTDRFDTNTIGPACVSTKPYQNLLAFHNLRVSRQYTAGAPTTFTGQPNSGSLSYYLGSDSDLGSVNINMTLNNTLTPLYDFFRVYMGTVSFTGSTSSATYGGTTWTNPLTSFTCP